MSVPVQSGKMNKRERGICARARQFREGIKWSQSDFAANLGITRDQLASIEYGRTPLRYDIAWKYNVLFGMSLSALAEEGFPVNFTELDRWPNPYLLKNPSILLSNVLDSLYNSEPDSLIVSQGKNPDAFSTNAPVPGYLHRAANLEFVIDLLKNSIAQVQTKSVFDFCGEIRSAIQKIAEKFPHESEERSLKELNDLNWFLIRKEISRRFQNDGHNFNLTQKATSSSLADVKVDPLWPALKNRLQEATAKSGSKTKLAKFLKVDLTRVSQWLSDSKTAREPGAEYALQMLYWVEHPEVQK